ncbi:MAG TPA: mechanosensitive ion channel [Rhodocyclaceae bacterium]|nr:mechanosensitive ion channel [Rhodocyclaceae bacterium]
MSGEFGLLLKELWADLQQPEIVWQVLVLALCLAVAWLVQRRLPVDRSREGVWKIGQRGLLRIAFPLTALVLVAMARAALKPWLHVNLLKLALPLLASLLVIRIVFFVIRHAFGKAGWLASFERLFAFLAWGVVALHITGLLPDLIGLLEDVRFTVGRQKLDLWMLIQGTGAVLVTLLLALWIGGAVESRLMAAKGLDSNVRVVLARLAKALILVMAVLTALPLVGIDLTTLSVFGGALGVGLGFGLQKIASNYVSGFIILLDRSIRIGDVIAVGQEKGLVSRITTRYTVVRAATGVEAIIPNEVLVGSVVLNESYTDPKVRLALSFQVAYGTDLERAMAILVEAARAQPRVLAEPPPGALLVAFGESGIDLELGVWIADPQAGSGPLRSEINLAVWRSFRAEGIEIPYPQREVRLLGPTA